jgi:hypothetical protein
MSHQAPDVETPGPVTREMVRARTIELTLLAGRNSLQIHRLDYERAKRELTGESDSDRQQAVLDRYQEPGRRPSRGRC